jgi:surface protein
MYGTFYQATNFNRDLSSWNVAAVTFMEDIFQGSPAAGVTLSGTWCDNPAAQGESSITLSNNCT